MSTIKSESKHDQSQMTRQEHFPDAKTWTPDAGHQPAVQGCPHCCHETGLLASSRAATPNMVSALRSFVLHLRPRLSPYTNIFLNFKRCHGDQFTSLQPKQRNYTKKLNTLFIVHFILLFFFQHLSCLVHAIGCRWSSPSCLFRFCLVLMSAGILFLPARARMDISGTAICLTVKGIVLLSLSLHVRETFFSQAANGQNSDAAILVYTREFLSLRLKVPKVHDVGLSDIRTKNKKWNKRL